MASIVPVKEYKGIRGWLLLLCILLVVLIPAKSVAYMAYYFAKLSTLFRQYPGILIPIIAYSFLALLMVGYSVYAGMVLWTVRRDAVSVAKRFLVVFAAFSFLDIGLLILFPTFAGLPFARASAVIPEALKGAFGQIIFVVLCYAYLHLSKRVQTTYQTYRREETMSHVT